MESQDFYFENNCIVLTESFLKKRGFCCHNGCRHCPYKNMKTRYILKTSNDLQFDFDHDDSVIVKGQILNSHFKSDICGPIKIQEMEKCGKSFVILIEDVEYIINEVIKYVRKE